MNTLESLKDDPHLNAVGFWQEVEHPTEGPIRMTRFPVSFFGYARRECGGMRRASASTPKKFCARQAWQRARLDALLDSGAARKA